MALIEQEMSKEELLESLEAAPSGKGYTLSLREFAVNGDVPQEELEENPGKAYEFPMSNGGVYYRVRFTIIEDPDGGEKHKGKQATFMVVKGSYKHALLVKAFPMLMTGKTLDTEAPKGERCKGELVVNEAFGGNDVKRVDPIGSKR